MARLNSSSALSMWKSLKPEAYADADFGVRSKIVYCKGPLLYNYGEHFPLAKYLGLDAQGRKTYILNGDQWRGSGGWGASTGQLQRDLLDLHGPIVSADALRAADVPFHRLELGMIVDWSKAQTTTNLLYNAETGAYAQFSWRYAHQRYVDVERDYDYEPWQPPRQGMFVPCAGPAAARPGEVLGYWHVLGAVLLKTAGRRLLCSVDEGRYFVSELARPAASVKAAFAQLKPKAARDAEKAGKTVPRQGEWFFVPTEFDAASLAAALGAPAKQIDALVRRGFPIPDERRTDNQHCADLLQIGDGKLVLARGKVRHRARFSGQLTGEHATVDLGGRWHRPVRNTEKASWSMDGRVD